MFKDGNELTIIGIVNAVLALFLFVSPWLIGFTETQAASWNAWIGGLLIGGVALTALKQQNEWADWAHVALGIWMIIAPWILGFSGVAAALWTHVGVGLVVAILAAIELWRLNSNPPAKAA